MEKNRRGSLSRPGSADKTDPAVQVTFQSCGGRLLSWGRLSSLPVQRDVSGAFSCWTCCSLQDAGTKFRASAQGRVSQRATKRPRNCASRKISEKQHRRIRPLPLARFVLEESQLLPASLEMPCSTEARCLEVSAGEGFFIFPPRNCLELSSKRGSPYMAFPRRLLTRPCTLGIFLRGLLDSRSANHPRLTNARRTLLPWVPTRSPISRHPSPSRRSFRASSISHCMLG